MNNTKQYCCDRFEFSVKEGLIAQAEDFDETEWFMPEGYHIYYCPFCGSYIAGQGFGKPPQPRK